MESFEFLLLRLWLASGASYGRLLGLAADTFFIAFPEKSSLAV
jgi:hypothetical protein